MYPPDVIQFNLACMAMNTEHAVELIDIGSKLMEKYADSPDIINGITRNLQTLNYRTKHDKKHDSHPGHRLFTPRLDRTEESRQRMYLSDEDYNKITRGKRGLMGTVTDLETGKRWKVYGASCGIPSCFCDAIAKPV